VAVGNGVVERPPRFKTTRWWCTSAQVIRRQQRTEPRCPYADRRAGRPTPGFATRCGLRNRPGRCPREAAVISEWEFQW